GAAVGAVGAPGTGGAGPAAGAVPAARASGAVGADTAGAPTGAPATPLTRVLHEVALVDRRHRAEARVWLTFVAQAAVDPELATVLRANYAELHGLLARLLAQSRAESERAESGRGRCGEDRTGRESRTPDAPASGTDRTAHALLALADGLTTHVLIGHLTSEAALAILDERIDAALAG
ncbi:TetR family transcriptional regulator C-terminal domain-containing protein, partial [Streptomyces sp. URMC 123]|uniref:TetR family transcriptional regulator C-terminal domain-containing protein n=1 Tax=Streptomyces sp. URMC 123 TaxID=3423403 RepID=UPI003F1CC6D5